MSKRDFPLETLIAIVPEETLPTCVAIVYATPDGRTLSLYFAGSANWVAEHLVQSGEIALLTLPALEPGQQVEQTYTQGDGVN